MFDLWAPGNSVLREKAIEHIFLSELSKALLLALRTPVEVLRSEFDANGYDLIVEARGIVRHIQLKATRAGGKRRSVDVNLALAEKPSGCVVWLMTEPDTLQIGPFYWLGGEPGCALPAPGGRTARHTRANAEGVKGERKGLRQVPLRAFRKLDGMIDVAEALFGPSHDRLLLAHLRARGVAFDDLAIPRDLKWENSVEFAHLIDGYELCAAARLGEAFDYPDRAHAAAAGGWRGSALELWVALFLEHRRDRFSGPIGIEMMIEPPPHLDELCHALVGALGTLQDRA